MTFVSCANAREKVKLGELDFKETSLSSEDKQYFQVYMSEVQRKIGYNWQTPNFRNLSKADQKQIKKSKTKSLSPVASFLVLPSGEIKNLHLSNKSGIYMYDQSCLDAIYRSKPFAPVKREVIIEFECKVNFKKRFRFF